MSSPPEDPRGTAAAPEEEEDGLWLMTFLNLMLVLLALFTMVVARKHFTKEPEKPASARADERAAELRARRERAAALRDRLQRLLEARGLQGTVDLHRGRPRIVLSSGVLFASGSAEIHAEARQRLREVAAVLGPLDRRILIEGHTDDRPIQTRRFPSNWELSMGRALAVVREFVGQGIPPRRMEFAGFGAHQPRRPNDSEDNRRLNRRIEIKVR